MQLWDELKGILVASLGFSPDQWVMWSAVIDERTSEGCRLLNECFFVFANCPAWPEHPHCRCRLYAISKPDIHTTAPIRKFTEYLFAEKGIRLGKASLFHKWGYSSEDSELLCAIYAEQASVKYREGEYELGRLDGFGQRVTILIELMDAKGVTRVVKSGWLVEPQGYLRLTTPFAG